MKRLDLIRRLSEEGCVFVRNGGSHDVYRNVITGRAEAGPRHREINEHLAKSIIRKLSAPAPDSERRFDPSEL